MNKIKKENIEKLEKWRHSLPYEKGISLAEAQMLYQQIKKIPQDKKRIRENLILGTLPLVYKNILSSGIMYVAYQDFDILDIMQDAVELWIGLLDSGVLTQINVYSDLFKINNFYYPLSRKYLIDFDKVSGAISSDWKKFDKAFSSYVDLCRKQPFTKFDVKKLFPGFSEGAYFLLKESYNVLDSEIQLFSEGEEFSLRQYRIMLPYLCQKILNGVYNKDKNILLSLLSKDEYAIVENHLLRKMMIENLETLTLRPRYLEILKKYHNLYGEDRDTLRKVAEDMNRSPETIRMMLERAYRKIWQLDREQNNLLRHIYEAYDSGISDSLFLGLRKK